MASLFEVAVLLLCFAFSGLHILQQVLDNLRARNPIVSATLLALCVAYFTGVIIVHLRVAPALPSPVVMRLFAATACSLLLLILAIV